MGLKKIFEELILNKSNSYRFYKKFYEEHKGNSNNPELEKQLEKLKKDFYNYKNKNDEYIDSANFLFTTLFIDYELNEPTTLLYYVQSLCKELLVLMSNICEKHDLEWWMTAGNLLGTVRHHDFIPWDDDIDIALMRKDYIKLYEVINEEIEKTGLGDIIRVHYRHRQIDGETINTFIQLSVVSPIDIRKKPVLARLDMLPFDFIIDYDEDTIEDDHYNAKLNFFRNIKNEKDFSITIKELYDELNLSMEKTDKIIPGVEGSFGKYNMSKLVILDAEEMLPVKQMPFNDIMTPVPNNPDYYLRTVYGDYLTVPKSIRTHSIVNSLRKSQNAKEVLEMCYNRIKEVNDKY